MRTKHTALEEHFTKVVLAMGYWYFTHKETNYKLDDATYSNIFENSTTKSFKKNILTNKQLTEV